jgi:2-polyprenyl-6-hydroxyphenyl methylase/3-demethylubiquinone-9 3-methyltransferase
MTETTIDTAEVEKFERMAADWWDPAGRFRPLHQLNPVRIGYIRDHAIRHFDRDGHARRPFEGLTVLDIGCGGGLLSEPTARLGATVTGIDATETNTRIARAHAERSGLNIDYRASTAEALAADGESFDLVLNMEVVEHVDNVPLFIRSCAALVKPGGLMVVSTINRTLRARALAIFAAENILRWLPRGTHDYDRLLTPEELAAFLTRNGLRVTDRTGVVFHPLANEWRQSPDLGINYMLVAEKAGPPAA